MIGYLNADCFEKTLQDEWVSFDIVTDLNDQSLYRLPNLRQVKYYAESLTISNDEIDLLGQKVIKTLNSKINAYEMRQWEFSLPPSGFHSKQQILVFTQHEFKKERVQKQNLSQHQLNGLWEQGEFEVVSNQENFPFVWKLSSYIIKGQKLVKKSFIKDCSNAFWQLYQIPKRIYSSKHTNCTEKMCQQLCAPSIWIGLKNILYTPLMIVSILIGFRRTFWEIQPMDVLNEIEKDRQNELLLRQDLNYQIFQIYNQQLIEFSAKEFTGSINKIAYDFEAKFRTISLQIEEFYLFKKQILRLIILNSRDQQFLSPYSISIELSDSVEESKLKVGMQMLNQMISKNITLKEMGLTNVVLGIVRAMQIVDMNYQVMQIETALKKKRVEQKIVDEHPYRHKVRNFYKPKVGNLMIKEIRNHKVQCHERTQEELRKFGFVQELTLYNNYLSKWNQYDRLFKEKEAKLILQVQKPSRVFNVYFKRCKPYSVIRVGQTFQFNKIKIINIDTSYYFWRLPLFLLSWISNFVNGTLTMFNYLLRGPFGIMALCSMNDFYTEQSCDPSTGVVLNTQNGTSVISGFMRVMEGMEASRKLFENSPDDGFFGKSCARLFNLVEVYLFRFLLVGVGGMLMVFPFLILINITFSTLILFTMFLWMTILSVGQLIIQWLLFDYNCEVMGEINESDTTSQPCSPILYEILGRFLMLGFMQIVFAIFGIGLHIFLIVFILVFAVIRIILRSMYDLIMFQLIKCFGRTPARETAYAWRIKGPGVTRAYYYQIQKEDLFTLVYASLESIELLCWQEKIKALILQPSLESQALLNRFFSVFKVKPNYQDPSVDKLIENLNQQVQRRMSIYPNKPLNRVRFSEEELEVLIPELTDFIKQTMLKRNMDPYIWNKLGLTFGSYSELVNKILMSSFNDPDIMKPIESLDQRIMLVCKTNFRSEIQRALQGKASLEKTRHKLKHKTIVKIDDTAIPVISCLDLNKLISALRTTQDDKNNWNSFDQPQLSLFLNCCLMKDK